MFNIHTLQMTSQLGLFIIVSQENSFYHPITGSIRGVFGRAVRGHQSLRYPRQARNDHAQGYPVGAPYSWRARLRSLSTCDDRTSSVFLLTFPFLACVCSYLQDKISDDSNFVAHVCFSVLGCKSRPRAHYSYISITVWFLILSRFSYYLCVFSV